MKENFEEYILDQKDKAGNFEKLINFYTNIWAGAKDGKNKKLIIKSCDCSCDCSSDSRCGNFELKGLRLKKYLENDKNLYESFKKDNEIKKCQKLNQLYFAGIPKKKNGKTLNIIVENIIKPNIKNLSPENLLNDLNEHNNNKTGSEKLSLYQSFISKYCHWHHEVNISENHFPIFDKNVKYSLVYYQMTGAEIKKYEHLKYFVDKFIEEYLPKKLTGANRIELKLEIKIEKNNVPELLHEEISIYRLVDKFLWLQYEIHSKILKENIKNIGAFSPSKICYQIQDS
jgi:hypothetical protein